MNQNFITQIFSTNSETTLGIEDFLVISNELGNTNTFWPFKPLTLNKILKEFNTFIYHTDTIEWLGLSKVSSFKNIPVFSKKHYRVFSKTNTAGYQKQIWQKSTSGTSGQPLILNFDTHFHLALKYSAIYKVLEQCTSLPFKEGEQLITVGITDYFDKELTLDICPYFKNYFVQSKIDVNNSSTIKKCIEFIIRYKPMTIRGKPYLLSLLADYIKQNNYKITFKPILLSSGCQISNATWIHCEEAFNTNLINLYGSTEMGVMAFQEAVDKPFELLDKDIYFEIIHDNSQASKNGKIVVTSLRNKLLPFFRYETGDLACFEDANSKKFFLKGRELPIFYNQKKQLLAANKISKALNDISIFDFHAFQDKIGSLLLVLHANTTLQNQTIKRLERILDCAITIENTGTLDLNNTNRFAANVEL